MQTDLSQETLKTIHKKLKEQELGSWKLIRLINADSKVLDNLRKTLGLSPEETGALSSRLLEFPLFVYPKAFQLSEESGSFHLDFDPANLISPEQSKQLLEILLKLSFEFKLKALVFDETDHKTVLIEIDSGYIANMV